MIESDKTATMEQVARAAGVSIGTVDRVLHHREGVSEKTRKKVFDVINEIGYKPNIYASILSRRKDFTIVAIIPYFQTGEYWELVYNGITRAVKQSQGLNIDLKIFTTISSSWSRSGGLAAIRSTCSPTPFSSHLFIRKKPFVWCII